MDKNLKKERIAKVLANWGICSRRMAESLIEQKRVKVNNDVINSPVVFVDAQDKILIDDCPVQKTNKKSRVWLYNKPRGLVVSHSDEQNRPTVFQNLPKDLPRVISVGRLDLDSEGLLLLTNDPTISRKAEDPNLGWKRVYRVRAFGIHQKNLIEKAQKGLTIDGIRYRPVLIKMDTEPFQGAKNQWFTITLTEGKNREIRKIMEHFDLKVSRLIRIEFGPFRLEPSLGSGKVSEVPTNQVKQYFFKPLKSDN